MVLLGAMMLVGWSVAGKAVAGIEDGSAATKLTEKLLNDPAFADAAAGRITDRLVEQTEGRFVGRLVVAFEPEIQRAIANVLTSDRVEEAVTNSVQKIESRLTDAITDPDRPSGPLVISVDLSDRVNERIDQIPVVGPFIPEVTVPPIEREVVDAATFDSVRQVYGGLKLVATWGLLVGALLIVGGFFVAPRSRWYWASALVGAAFVVLAVSIAVRRIIPAQIAAAVPGGETGGGGTFLSNFVADNATGPIASRLLAMAFWAFLLAVLFALVARYLPGWRDQYVAANAPKAPIAEAVVAEANLAPVAVTPASVAVTPAVVVVDLPVAPEPEPEPQLIVDETPAEPLPVPLAEGAEVAETAPVVVTSAATKPTATKPAATKPTAAKAPATKPTATKPTATKPAATKPAATKPAATKPAATKPAAKATDAASGKPAPKAPRTRKPAPPKE